jgi:hypothetical protein
MKKIIIMLLTVLTLSCEKVGPAKYGEVKAYQTYLSGILDPGTLVYWETGRVFYLLDISKATPTLCILEMHSSISGNKLSTGEYEAFDALVSGELEIVFSGRRLSPQFRWNPEIQELTKVTRVKNLNGTTTTTSRLVPLFVAEGFQSESLNKVGNQ